MVNRCEGCERFDNMCIRNHRCPIIPDLEFCEECGAGIEVDKLPPEDVRMSTEHEEFWGAPCSYEVVVGYCCPECGHENRF